MPNTPGKQRGEGGGQDNVTASPKNRSIEGKTARLQQKPLWGIFGQRSRFPGSHAGDTSINLCVISSPRKNRCR